MKVQLNAPVFNIFHIKITINTKVFFLFLLLFWQMVLNFSQDCKQILKKIKFLLFLNIKSNFIYINILHCYCVSKCEMCYIIKNQNT